MLTAIKVVLAAALLLAPTLASEVATRSLIETGRLPIAPSSNDFADVSLANLIRLGKPDVLIMGTSVTRNGIQPDVLEELIEAETGSAVHVQGVAQSAMSLKAQRLLARGLAGLDLLPDTVVTGLSSMSLIGDHRDGDWFIDSELGKLWSGCERVDDVEAAVECWLGQASSLWRWRGHPEKYVRALERGMPRTITRRGIKLHQNGWTSARPATAKLLRRDLPASLARLAPDVSVPDEVVEAFASFVAELRSHGVEVVVVTIPYSPRLERALRERNPDWDAQRQASMATLEEAADIDIIDVGSVGEWARASSFYDLRHLSREGADPFTRQLWSTPDIRAAILAGLDREP